MQCSRGREAKNNSLFDEVETGVETLHFTPILAIDRVTRVVFEIEDVQNEERRRRGYRLAEGDAFLPRLDEIELIAVASEVDVHELSDGRSDAGKGRLHGWRHSIVPIFIGH